ncbi:hypothetical protein QQG74_17325 [Micromonospora sp. FIMYZ51]
MTVEIDSLVHALNYQSLLTLDSSPQLVDDVLRYAETHAKQREAYWYHKMLTPVDIGKGSLLTSPARVLHELGVATTLLTASPLSQVARHWAAVRYCATLTRAKGRRLALTADANEVVYHHKVTQSEQLGIGLALVVAKRLLRQQYRGWTFHAVDAEVALKAGFVVGAGTVESVSRTKKRPDYILLGHRATKSRRRMKIVVLECKGTHQAQNFVHGQLARAAVQVQALKVGGRLPPSLMVASHLTQTGITAYVLDPPGDDELWSGGDDELDELLSTSPEDQFWHPRMTTPDEARVRQAPARGPSQTEEAAPDPAAAEELPPGAPEVFEIPEQRRSWFTQILTRAVAATALLFAGDSATASGYATPRQRGTRDSEAQPGLFDLDPAWATSSAMTVELPGGISAEGTRYRAPLGRGRTLEVFRGVESRLYRQLAEGRIGTYLREAPGPFWRVGSIAGRWRSLLIWPGWNRPRPSRSGQRQVSRAHEPGFAPSCQLDASGGLIGIPSVTFGSQSTTVMRRLARFGGELAASWTFDGASTVLAGGSRPVRPDRRLRRGCDRHLGGGGHCPGYRRSCPARAAAGADRRQRLGVVVGESAAVATGLER